MILVKSFGYRTILYNLHCNYKFIKYVCVKTKTGGQATKKNIMLGSEIGLVLFCLFQKF